MNSSDLSPRFKEQTFYEIKELSSILKMNYRTILDLIATGELQAYRIGRVFRISTIQLNDFLKSKEIKTTINPIKTLTPRLIVRAVEKMKKKKQEETK